MLTLNLSRLRLGGHLLDMESLTTWSLVPPAVGCLLLQAAEAPSSAALVLVLGNGLQDHNRGKSCQ